MRVDHCRKCEYDLTGLGETGRCPECGNPFDIRSGMGVEWVNDNPDADLDERFNRFARTIGLSILAVTILICSGMGAWVLRSWICLLPSTAILLLIPVIVFVYFYEKSGG